MFCTEKVFKAFIVTLVVLVFLLPNLLFSLEQEESKKKEDSQTDKLFKMSLEELMKVKVTTASRTPERIGEIPASVVLITREDIEIFGYRTLAEILENIPGLYAIDDYGEYGANFGVRGFWSGVVNDNMIILVNHVHQINDIFSNYPLNNIAVPIEAIDRIEVIRGPMSVVYGNGAFYGVINIITDDNFYGPTSILEGAVGSENTKKLFLRKAGSEGDFDYVLNASLYDTDGFDYGLSEMVTDPSILPLLGVPVDSRTGGRLENNEKYFNFSGNFKGFFVKLSYNDTKKECYFNLPSYSYGTYIRNNTTHISFGYRKKLSDILTAEGKLTYSKSRDSVKYNVLFDDFYGIQNFDTSGIEVELNTFISPSSALDITTGVYYRAVLDVTDMYDLPSFGLSFYENTNIFLAENDDIVTRAVFTQITYSPIDSLRLVAGVRLEQTPKYELESTRTIGTEPTVKVSGIYDEEKIEIIPRLAAIFYLNDDNIFKFLFGKAINRPSFFQNTHNSLDPNRDNLEPESIQTLELNYISNLSSVFTLNASVFRNTLNKLITRIVEFDEQTNEYESWSFNAGKMVTNGIELTLNAEPVLNFRMEFSGTYQRTEDKRDGYKDIEVAYSPKFLGYVKASYRWDTFTVALTGNYVGAMETFWDEAKENPDSSFGGRIGEKVDGYLLLGANVRIEDLFVDGLYLNIRCSNLLNEEIRYPTYTNNPWADRGTIGIGRTFLVSLGYKF
ncbi:MAG: TonB-dependent receptor [Candidatus Aminicenantes bacterium]|nr:TonB-dependent receptor [Candidatus Aminicenantes bacterium]NIM81006.1 TonB-dependent receptor [Candidatus Aminicenantes bacterium]NIN20385.1 TonB-dependent receptor [Candidatus Aminicenantes bacterium]NIN44158.1 TonB-dependent receptor [Candidatus Aminicenantes bacterium]NIN86976.1 TonB-dependent receptor [Candidatus Aminicenantes bacterium]